jgi:hypothetical protein
MYQSWFIVWNCDKETQHLLNEFLDWHWPLSPNTSSSLLFPSHFLSNCYVPLHSCWLNICVCTSR